MKKIIVLIFVTFIVFVNVFAVEKVNYKYDGMYLIKKDGSYVYMNKQDAFYCKIIYFGQVGEDNGVSITTLTNTPSSPLIVVKPKDVPKVKLSEIERIDLLGDYQGNLRFHVGSTMANWKNLENTQNRIFKLFNSENYEKEDENSWMAFKYDYGSKAFLIDNSRPKIKSLEMTEDTITSIKNDWKDIKQGEGNLGLFITYTVSGRKFDEGWVIELTGD